MIVWYIIGELGSLAEHAVTFGAPVPSWLRNILEIGKNAVDAAGGEHRRRGRRRRSEGKRKHQKRIGIKPLCG